MIPGEWKIWAGLVLLLLAGAAWLWIGQLRAERDLAAMQVQTLTRENTSLIIEMESNAKALAVRDAERIRLAAEKAALEAKLREVYDHDEEARAWADSPCPDGVLECLRR